MKFADKLKNIRKFNNLTQEQFANSIGISRSNLANIESGNVKPTELFINCISLKYNLNKNWLVDDSDDDLNELTQSHILAEQIAEKYMLLDDKYKKLIENQINQLLELQ